MVNGYARNRKPDTAFKMLLEMRKARCKPDRVIYFVSVCCISVSLSHTHSPSLSLSVCAHLQNVDGEMRKCMCVCVCVCMVCMYVFACVYHKARCKPDRVIYFVSVCICVYLCVCARACVRSKCCYRCAKRDASHTG